jgi:hypothetical protein
LDGQKVKVANTAARVYFSAWTKKNIKSYNKVMIKRLLVLGPDGAILLYTDEEKTIAKFPGRMSLKKMKEAVKAYVELELRDEEPMVSVPLENVTILDMGEIERIIASMRSGAESTG